MKKSADRQTQTRMIFPNTSLFIKQTESFVKQFSYDGPNEIVNLSKSGAGFISALRLKKDENIKLKIKFPGEKDLVLKGKVKWIDQINGNGTYRYGIQFHPFGHRKHYNSFENLKRLNNLNM